jgi:hypothetical protein
MFTDSAGHVNLKRDFTWLEDAREKAVVARRRKAGSKTSRMTYSFEEPTETTGTQKFTIPMYEYNVHRDSPTTRNLYSVTIESTREEIEAYRNWYTEVFSSSDSSTNTQDGWGKDNDPFVGQIDDYDLDILSIKLDAKRNRTESVSIKSLLRTLFGF